jgi:outer membrane protein assembly factor BamE (lipoprotein component of BamABCDE complex)
LTFFGANFNISFIVQHKIKNKKKENTMSKTIKLFLCALIISSFTACSSVTGPQELQSSASVNSFIVDGQTTENQVREKLGDPDKITTIDGKKAFVYKYRSTDLTSPWLLIGVGRESVKKRELTLVFKNGKVVKHFYTKRDHKKFVGE